jgi:hypothetical protein
MTAIAQAGPVVGSAKVSIFVRIRQLLPKGIHLTDAAWQSRHRLIQVVLWLQIPILIAVGLARGYSPLHTLLEVSPVAILAGLGYYAPSRGMKAILISTGLLMTEAILVHFTGGLIEAHFAFFVMMPLVALYQDLRAFGIALGFVVVHHTVMTLVAPKSVFNHHAAQAKPLLWAGIHAGFVLALVGIMLAFWRFAEQGQLELATAARGMARSAADVQRLSDELAHSADTQSLTVEMINESLVDVQSRVEASQLSQADPDLLASLGQIVEAVHLIGDLTRQHANSSERATEATRDLTAQASHLSSLAPVDA